MSLTAMSEGFSALIGIYSCYQNIVSSDKTTLTIGGNFILSCKNNAHACGVYIESTVTCQQTSCCDYDHGLNDVSRGCKQYIDPSEKGLVRLMSINGAVVGKLGYNGATVPYRKKSSSSTTTSSTTSPNTGNTSGSISITSTVYTSGSSTSTTPTPTPEPTAAETPETPEPTASISTSTQASSSSLAIMNLLLSVLSMITGVALI
ncbi:hypothetical protein PC129_g23098 [Phytophthora cactorum]|uniref:Uncharacterized protein n=1 Tax=Phytophthora cactorum TaxID=29920 RepID=A0A329RF86_9STRA|nr:hypothetical protein PC111_g23090 [Phytophthora cactorum]KAG2793661.1 hypothetical protein PC112_g23348 [Phytophthora cactorum]KAG2815220.1 hypothetical protein PC113_g23231 [Phytophthora cactorum]KAG2875920.1 hypothetical protein PC114_g24463 [Phytophthora cactorum]KAG2882889.1 hypothetical protein PC115_g21810 [Phytophthora cactorum]